jgi:hypothetical protein
MGGGGIPWIAGRGGGFHGQFWAWGRTNTAETEPEPETGILCVWERQGGVVGRSVCLYVVPLGTRSNLII